MDIIKANKCLYYLYRPLQKGTFNSKDVSKVEGEPQPDRISPSQALKLRVTAYEKAQAEAAVVQLIREDEDNEKDEAGEEAEEEAEEEALEAEFAAIEAILDQGDNTYDGDEGGEVNEDDNQRI